MEKEWIVVRGVGSLSGLGSTPEEVANAYASDRTFFSSMDCQGTSVAVSPLSASGEEVLKKLVQEKPKYASLDRSVMMAIAAARQAVEQAGWDANEAPIGINIGSSRGATGLFEQFHSDFLSNPSAKASALVSPNTTLGNLASWVAQDLLAQGPLISHSMTCSTALQAFANGVAWLKAGMAKRFLVGGTEAPLTSFTLAQMRSIGIYSPFAPLDNPCRPLGQQHNTFVLGEGAAVFALERMTEAEISRLSSSDHIIVAGVGMGFEHAPSRTGITPDGQHFQRAMQEAIQQAGVTPEEVDALVLHAPGTKAGDTAEAKAVSNIFEGSSPALTSNKHRIGHTLGASGAISATLAIHLLKNYNINPFNSIKTGSKKIDSANYILINAAGFGGNASSLLLRKYNHI